MLLTLTVVHGWHTKQINFVQAFAQAPVEKSVNIELDFEQYEVNDWCVFY
jgi:hypothetical protein